MEHDEDDAPESDGTSDIVLSKICYVEISLSGDLVVQLVLSPVRGSHDPRLPFRSCTKTARSTSFLQVRNDSEGMFLYLVASHVRG